MATIHLTSRPDRVCPLTLRQAQIIRGALLAELDFIEGTEDFLSPAEKATYRAEYADALSAIERFLEDSNG